MCVRERERKRESVCVCERERKREREREREEERERERKKEREREREDAFSSRWLHPANQYEPLLIPTARPKSTASRCKEDDRNVSKSFR